MIQELLTIGLPVAKFILAAALMVVFYKLLYKEKTTFNHCRIFLLSIAFVSLLISQFNIVVYTPPATIVEIKYPQPMPSVTLKSVETPALVQPAVLEKTPSFQRQIQDFLTVKNSLLLTYILVAFVLLVSLFIQFFQILAAKRKGNVILQDGYEMVMSPDIAAPFSFHKSIFIGTRLTGSKLEMIVKHELWHIKHHHYLDVLVMEILVRIFWFNPILWWVRKELRNVSEFQADRSVLDEGHDLYKYQTIILEEVMAHNPYLSNGFNNSFTKKRFIMMKNKCQIRMTTLRRALILPFLVGVFSLLSLSVGKSQVKYVTTTTLGNQTITKTVESDSLNSAATVTTIDTSFSVNDVNATSTNNIKFDLNSGTQSKEEVDKALNNCSLGLSQAIPELRKLAKNPDVNFRKKGLNIVFKSLDVTANGANAGDYAFSDAFVASFTSEDFDKSADNFSKIKTNIDALKIEQSSNTRLTGLQKQIMLLMQDGVMSKVLTEVLTGTMGAMMGSMENMMGAKEGKGEVTNMVKGLLTNITGALGSMSGSQAIEQSGTTDSENNYDEREERDRILLKNAYELKPFQYKVIFMPYLWESSIYNISRDKKETKITMIIPMASASTWFRIDSDFRLIDTATKDQYLVRRIENGIPFNQLLKLSDCKNTMIAITLIFPPLKKSVKEIDIFERNSPGSEMPSNAGGPYQFMNVKLSQFADANTSDGKVYK